MATFGRCCCDCEGCTRGQLDEWLNEIPNIADPERWRFTNGTYPVFQDFEKPAAECSSTCENVKLFAPLEEPPDAGIFAPWVQWYRYRCQQDIDGDLYCQRQSVFLSAKLDYPGFEPKIRVLRGKVYNSCDDTKPEECTYLAIASITADWEIWSAGYAGPGGTGLVPCASLYPYPSASDIPHPSTWVSIGGGQYTSASGDWIFGRVTVAGGGFITGTMNVNRARTVGNLTEDKIPAGGIDWGVGFVPAKHQPVCCTYWDCDLTDLDCSPPATYQVTIDAPFFVTPHPCSPGIPSTEFFQQDATITLDGGDWYIYDA